MDKFSDYALCILIALTAYALKKLSTSQIARMYGISENHLAKIATQLSKGGFVVSESGRGGGLTLAVLAVDISIGAVLRALKKDETVAECVGSNTSCAILLACSLSDPLLEARSVLCCFSWLFACGCCQGERVFEGSVSRLDQHSGAIHTPH